MTHAAKVENQGKAKVGRPTKATPKLIDAILADLANGMSREQACACNDVSIGTFREWEKRPEFPDLRAKAQGLRIKALLALQEAAAQAGEQWRWKHYTWSLEKIYRRQYGDSAELVIYEQNNYELSEEKVREIEARVERLSLDPNNSNG